MGLFQSPKAIVAKSYYPEEKGSHWDIVLGSRPKRRYFMSSHLYPPIPIYTHLYPSIPIYTHLYPPIPTYTHLYPPIPTYTHQKTA